MQALPYMSATLDCELVESRDHALSVPVSLCLSTAPRAGHSS